MDHSVKLGSISHGTLRTADLLESFADELERFINPLMLEAAKAPYAAWALLISNSRAEAIRLLRNEIGGDEESAAVLDRLYDALETFAPPYCYFGSNEGDGADMGFWLAPEWEIMAQEDGVPIVRSLSQVAEGYVGDVLVTTDHRNVTLYNAQPRFIEVWAVV
jgi:hypothetical protein